eukprot:12542178-Alexandrium_andersonii.AAC.1
MHNLGGCVAGSGHAFGLKALLRCLPLWVLNAALARSPGDGLETQPAARELQVGRSEARSRPGS